MILLLNVIAGKLNKFLECQDVKSSKFQSPKNILNFVELFKFYTWRSNSAEKEDDVSVIDLNGFVKNK